MADALADCVSEAAAEAIQLETFCVGVDSVRSLWIAPYFLLD
ncbi:hypothetical protein ACU42Y_11740 [Proteus mirabilis]